MRRMIGVAAAAMLLAPMAWAGQQAPLEWMVGNWHTETGAGPEAAERWRPMHGGAMTGVSHSFTGGKPSSTETMSISFDGDTAIFHASPDGAGTVDFREVSHGPREIVFENDAHDYPQRIRYWRDGDFLMAEISLKDGSHAIRWKYRGVSLD